MKRYFLFDKPPERNSYRPRGQFYWMTLPCGRCIGVLTEEGGYVPLDWFPLPQLTNSTAAGLREFGCLPSDTMYQAAVKLSHINEHFHP